MMKTKILIALFTLICVMVALAACTEKHEFSTKWESDANNHWHACSNADCSDKTVAIAHTFGEGKVTTPATEAADGVMTYTCTVCGYAKTEPIPQIGHEHSWESEWSNDETYHWYASTCGHDDGAKLYHVFDDGYIVEDATDAKTGVIIYTCVDCGYDYEDVLPMKDHRHQFADEWTYNENQHWHVTTCGHDIKKGVATHDLSEGKVTKEPTEDEEGLTCYYCGTCDYVKEEVMPKLPHVHVFNEETLTCKCGLVHTTCEVCGNCSTLGCVDHLAQCQLTDEDRIIYYAPSTALGAPEGPNGKKPGSDGAYIYDESITASYTVLDNGAHATLITLPNGTKAHSGVSLCNNQNAAANGKAGYNCGIPLIGGYTKHIRMYFTNTGNSDVTIKYSAIDYYYDYGVIELTIKAGETKVALLKTLRTSASTGLNHQIVFTEDAAAGASVAIWGEYAADENLSGVSVSVAAKKLQFAVGQTFSAEGLILRASGTNHSSVYITGNYKTDLDGYVFTAEDAAAGKKTVTVNFAGFTATYEVAVYDHVHNIEYVEKKDVVPCADGTAGTDGLEAYYICKVEGCGMYFTDATGNKVTTAPDKVSCHTESKALPGEAISCTECAADIGTKSMENWVLFNPAAQIHSYKGSITKDNIVLAYGDVNDLPGTYVTFKQGTVGNASNTQGFKFYCENDLESDNGIPQQHKLPNVGTNVPDGSTRVLMVRFVNYGTEDVTVTFINDNYSSASITVTIPAGGTAFAETTLRKQAGYNYFDFYLNNTEALKSDVKIGMYGYFELLDGEIDAPTVKQAASKIEFKVGDTFSTEGLVLSANLPNSNGRVIYASTGYTTSLDGYVFKAEDAGNTIAVTVELAGKTCTYNITVSE